MDNKLSPLGELSREHVRSEYPRSHWVYLSHKEQFVEIWDGDGKKTLGAACTESGAWISASINLLSEEEDDPQSKVDSINAANAGNGNWWAGKR